MQTFVAILTWLGLAAAGVAVAAGVLVAVLAWLLNHPVEDDEARRTVTRC